MNDPAFIAWSRLLAGLEGLREHAVERRNALAALYEGRPIPPMDPRVVTARHLKAVAGTTLISVSHLHDDLLDLSWWNRRFGQPGGAMLLADQVRDDVEDFEVMCRFSMIAAGQSLFEAGARSLLRVLSPVDGPGRSRGVWIRQVAKPLLELLGDHVRGDPIPLETLEVLALIRNLQHNNGRFFPTRPHDVPDGWRQWPLSFVEGKPFSNAYWAFLIELFTELVDINWQVMTSPPVVQLPDDAFAFLLDQA